LLRNFHHLRPVEIMKGSCNTTYPLYVIRAVHYLDGTTVKILVFTFYVLSLYYQWGHSLSRRGRRWSCMTKKNPLTFVKGLLVFKGEGFYPSTTLYLVPNKLIFLMLSMVKDCGFTLLSWGCLELSDFLTSKD
jgi:hypothetical protein